MVARLDEHSLIMNEYNNPLFTTIFLRALLNTCITTCFGLNPSYQQVLRTKDCCTHSLLHAQQDALTQYNSLIKCLLLWLCIIYFTILKNNYLRMCECFLWAQEPVWMTWSSENSWPYRTLGFTQPLTEISTRNIKIIMFPGSKVRRVCRADNLTANCEPTV
jgi:hypothetical protein